jgi:hypothetical protein
MLRRQAIAVALVAYCLMAASPAAATAQKKLTYEQAWAKCRTLIGKAVGSDQHSARMAWGSACMRKYGHRI